MGIAASGTAATNTPGSRVRVPPAEEVIFQVPPNITTAVQWTKNGKALAGAIGNTFTIPLATSTDSGVYAVTGLASPAVATGITLDVVPASNLANFSVLLTIPPGGTSPSLGFVVTGQTPTSFMIRGVGPSLRAFGIAQPAAQPVVHYYNSAGLEFGFARVDALPGDIDYAATFATAGAFPLTAMGDFVDFGPFAPGAYTINATDSSGLGGTVLLETYQGVTPTIVPPLGVTTTPAPIPVAAPP